MTTSQANRPAPGLWMGALVCCIHYHGSRNTGAAHTAWMFLTLFGQAIALPCAYDVLMASSWLWISLVLPAGVIFQLNSFLATWTGNTNHLLSLTILDIGGWERINTCMSSFSLSMLILLLLLTYCWHCVSLRCTMCRFDAFIYYGIRLPQ